ncbi:Hydrolase_2 domain-containing protein [Ruminococcaceae bacterium BL-6]|nr:Hydrolase_2 domain-containing protein [Ruminococcaceae bacterium BL-6]
MQKIGLLCLMILTFLFLGNSTNKYNKVVRTTTPIHAVARMPVELEKRKVQLTKAPTTVKKEKPKYSQKDLYYLTAVIYQEARGEECSDEMQRMVANVVINRVAHPDFSNSIHAVLTAKYQYGNMWKNGVKIPPGANKEIVQRCEKNAKYILEGNRVCPSNILYQSEFRDLGDGIYKQFKTKYGTMYFNYSIRK